MTWQAGPATATAYLRVYEPLAAFDGDERRHWEAYVRAGRAPSLEEGVAQERWAALRSLVAVPVRALPQVEDEAFVTEVDGVHLVCPWSTRLRSLEALEAFRADLPDEVAEAFVPRSLLEACDEELERLREQHPDARRHVLSSPWQVPLRWFVLVDAQEKQVDLGSVGGSGTAPAGLSGRRLVYRTAMSRARRRTARALDVLRRTLDEGPVVEGVEEMGRWLEEFHPRSLVELDYGGLAHLLDDAELSQDDSARDIAHALGALADGDASEAAAAYGRVTARSKALRAVEAAN